MGDRVDIVRNRALYDIMSDGAVDAGIGLTTSWMPWSPLPEGIAKTATNISEHGFGWLRDPAAWGKIASDFASAAGADYLSASPVSGIAAGIGFGMGMYAGAVEYAADSAMSAWWRSP
ncbi:MAG: hypothetical protein ACK5Z4_08485 [Planctomyces sp.]